MLRVIAVIGAGLAKVAAECPSGDAICQDQEMPSNSLLQREKRALGKELAEDNRMAETEAQARVRLAKELNSENFTISLGDCNPMSGAKDTSCCWAKGISCTNPPFTPEAACPLGALCTAPMNINPFAAPSYGYCQCQGGSSCQQGPLGDGCAVAFPNPFGEKNETKETADLTEETAQVTAKAKAVEEVPSEPKDVLVQEKVNDTKAGCYAGTKDMSCCLSRGMTCTNPPQLSSAQSTSCPVGAVCSAAFNLNPFAAPQYGYCQCQLGALCSSDGNSCGGAGSALDPFLKCSGSWQDPPNCCPRRLTCTNPPMMNNLTSTTCDLGQACDAEPTFGGMAPVFGTCKCMVGSCGATGQCGR